MNKTLKLELNLDFAEVSTYEVTLNITANGCTVKETKVADKVKENIDVVTSPLKPIEVKETPEEVVEEATTTEEVKQLFDDLIVEGKWTAFDLEVNAANNGKIVTCFELINDLIDNEEAEFDFNGHVVRRENNVVKFFKDNVVVKGVKMVDKEPLMVEVFKLFSIDVKKDLILDAYNKIGYLDINSLNDYLDGKEKEPSVAVAKGKIELPAKSGKGLGFSVNAAKQLLQRCKKVNKYISAGYKKTEIYKINSITGKVIELKRDKEGNFLVFKEGVCYSKHAVKDYQEAIIDFVGLQFGYSNMSDFRTKARNYLQAELSNHLEAEKAKTKRISTGTFETRIKSAYKRLVKCIRSGEEGQLYDSIVLGQNSKDQQRVKLELFKKGTLGIVTKYDAESKEVISTKEFLLGNSDPRALAGILSFEYIITYSNLLGQYNKKLEITNLKDYSVWLSNNM